METIDFEAEARGWIRTVLDDNDASCVRLVEPLSALLRVTAARAEANALEDMAARLHEQAARLEANRARERDREVTRAAPEGTVGMIPTVTP